MSVNIMTKNGVVQVAGAGGSGNANIKEVTQEEYDALPESKESDGVVYAITDAEADVLEAIKAEYDAGSQKLSISGAGLEVNNIDDNKVGLDTTWSSSKISGEISSLGIASRDLVPNQVGATGSYIRIGNIVFVSATITKTATSWTIFGGAPIPKGAVTITVGVLGTNDTLNHLVWVTNEGTIQVRTTTFSETFNVSFSYIAE